MYVCTACSEFCEFFYQVLSNVAWIMWLVSWNPCRSSEGASLEQNKKQVLYSCLSQKRTGQRDWKRFYPSLAALVNPVQNIFLLTVHYFNWCVPIAQHPELAVRKTRSQNWFLSKEIWVRPMSRSATSPSGQSVCWMERWIPIQPRAGIFKKSMGARHRRGIGFSYRPARLHRLAEFIPWHQFRGPINI